jgi:hypothetical protein
VACYIIIGKEAIWFALWSTICLWYCVSYKMQIIIWSLEHWNCMFSPTINGFSNLHRCMGVLQSQATAFAHLQLDPFFNWPTHTSDQTCGFPYPLVNRVSTVLLRGSLPAHILHHFVCGYSINRKPPDTRPLLWHRGKCQLKTSAHLYVQQKSNVP